MILAFSASIESPLDNICLRSTSIRCGKIAPSAMLCERQTLLPFELNDRQTQALIGIHGLCRYQDVTALIPVLTAREALWTLVQIKRVGYVGDLKEYSESCLQRLKQCS